MPGYLRVGGIVCVAVLALCLSVSASAAAVHSDVRRTSVVDNFGIGRSRTETTGVEPALLGTDTAQSALAAVTPAEEGPRKVAVLLMNVPGGFGGTWSPEETRSKVFTATDSANSFYKEESYGEISLTGKLRSDGDVFGWYALAPRSGGCPYEEWDDEADHLAEAAGVDLSGYQHVIYISTLQLSCDWSGIADVGGSRVNINGNTAPGVIAHELGHNLGLEHAGSWTCTEGGVRVQISNTCTTSEYGDPFDTMGNATANRHNSGWNLAKLGILGPGNIETATESGVYSIRSAFSRTSEPTVLRIARTRSPSHFVTSWYYLEIRQAGGVFESSDAATTGVSIRATAEGASPETLLLDANPSTATFADAPLQQGEVFDGGRVKFKTLSAGAGRATIEVELNTQPPAAPDDLHATVGAEGLQLDWNDPDSAEVDRYLVYRDGELVGSEINRSFLDFRPPAGEHEYVVVAEDEEENQSAPSAPLKVTVPVVSGPTCSAGSCKVAFRYWGAPSTWTVPPGVTEAFVTAEGARGGGRAVAPERSGASGARIWATLGPLTTGQVAEINVGGEGERYSEGGAGGFNGGGGGGHGGGGGGYTKLELESTLEVLAGGGGGGGLDGHNGSLIVTGGRGGNGGEAGFAGTHGTQTSAAGATLKGGEGGGSGGTGGAAGEGGALVGSTTCEGAEVGVSGGAGGSFTAGGGVAEAGGGGGGGYVGGGQGGAGAADTCGDKAAYGGGGGGSSFVAPGHSEGGESAGDGDGWLGIEYDDPVTAAAGEYTTFGGQALDVSAALGVLSGSSSPNPGSLSASLIDPPADGSLTLDPDGSFTYLPEPGFLGTDSFVYRATEGSGNYAEATATVNVAGAPSATASSPPPAETYVVGQVVPTSFSCSEGPGGPGLLSCDDSNGATSVMGGAGRLDTTTVGHHAYTVTAVSKDGLTGDTSVEYEVVPAPPDEPSGGPSPSGGPATPGPPAPPGNTEGGHPTVEISSVAASGSLRELLRTGRLDLRVKLGGAATLVLSGRVKRRVGSDGPTVVVLGPKSVRFAAAGEKKVTLLLTPGGRKVLRHLREAKILIGAVATDAADGVTRRTLSLRFAPR